MRAGRVVWAIAFVWLASITPSPAGEREKPVLAGTYFLDGDRVLVRLSLDREHLCEMLGPDGQQLTVRSRIDGRELRLTSGQIQRAFTYRIQDGDLLLTPAGDDRPDRAHLLGGMPPTERGEERRYVSLRNWTAKGRLAELVPPVAKPVKSPEDSGTTGNREDAAPPVQRRLAADIPMKIVNERIILNVKLDDEIECRAVLDTGALSCLLDLSLVELKKPQLGDERRLLFPYIGAMDARDLTLKSFALGPHRIKDFRLAAVQRDAPLNRDAPVLLGMELLKNQPFTLDFARRRFVFWMPGSILPEPGEGLTRVKLDLVPDPIKDGGRPHVRVPVNGAAQTLFLVDTGAPLPFFLRALKPVEQGFTETWPVSRMPTFMGGAFQDLPLLLAKYRRIELGSWVLEDQVGFLLDMSAQQKRVYSGDLDSLLNLIGMPFLRKLPAVHFDVPNRAMYIDKPKD